MDDTSRLVLAVIIGTVLVLAMIFFVVMLLVVNANRRHKHRAELAEMNMRREREVMEAEREATRQTLREVGRELHDNVGQLLTVAQLGLNTVLDRSNDPRLSSSREALEQGMDEVRRLGRSLNSDMWERRTLQDAIRAEAERLERVGHVKALLLATDGIADPPTDTKTILFRVFQEMIANALRHGRADTIEIHLDHGPSIAVMDNGVGFDMENTERRSGLVNIERRCELIGYQAICTSAPGKGTSWRIQQKNSTHGA
jgi:signal transduction histidine kinase